VSTRQPRILTMRVVVIEPLQPPSCLLRQVRQPRKTLVSRHRFVHIHGTPIVMSHLSCVTCLSGRGQRLLPIRIGGDWKIEGASRWGPRVCLACLPACSYGSQPQLTPYRYVMPQDDNDPCDGIDCRCHINCGREVILCPYSVAEAGGHCVGESGGTCYHGACVGAAEAQRVPERAGGCTYADGVIDCIDDDTYPPVNRSPPFSIITSSHTSRRSNPTASATAPATADIGPVPAAQAAAAMAQMIAGASSGATTG